MGDDIFRLDGKKALVTGGSRGLGLAIAKGLARHGAEVAIAARDERQLQEASQQITEAGGKRAWTFSFDLHQLEAAGEFFDEVLAATNGVDILVNCAGTTRRAPAEDLTIDDWNEVIQVNLSAAFAVSQPFCRHRKQSGGGGKIINMGSLMCRAGRPTTVAYTASKGGLLLLTRTLAVEWAKYNINVNAIGPGYFDTELTKPLVENKEFNRWVLSKTPMGRWGRPADLIGTAVFLASSASDFITGQIIYIDGGWLAGL